MITLILYSVLTYTFPVHILRKLNSKTVLISSLLTIIVAFLPQILSFYFFNKMQKEEYLLTIEEVEKTTNPSDILGDIILDNPELVDMINYFLVRETESILASGVNLVVTALTISYLTGGLLINRKIGRNKQKAKTIYRDMIKDRVPISYQVLQKCSFYGGEEYENLLLNNEVTSKLIKENEVNLDIPDLSVKTRLIAWWKRNSVIYRFYADMKKALVK